MKSGVAIAHLIKRQKQDFLLRWVDVLANGSLRQKVNVL